MKLKIKSFILLMILLIQLFYFAVFKIDAQKYLGHQPTIFTKEYAGGEVITQSGWGYRVDEYFPLTTRYDPYQGHSELIVENSPIAILFIFIIFDLNYFIFFIALDKSSARRANSATSEEPLPI